MVVSRAGSCDPHHGSSSSQSSGRQCHRERRHKSLPLLILLLLLLVLRFMRPIALGTYNLILFYYLCESLFLRNLIFFWFYVEIFFAGKGFDLFRSEMGSGPFDFMGNLALVYKGEINVFM